MKSIKNLAKIMLIPAMLATSGLAGKLTAGDKDVPQQGSSQWYAQMYDKRLERTINYVKNGQDDCAYMAMDIPEETWVDGRKKLYDELRDQLVTHKDAKIKKFMFNTKMGPKRLIEISSTEEDGSTLVMAYYQNTDGKLTTPSVGNETFPYLSDGLKTETFGWYNQALKRYKELNGKEPSDPFEDPGLVSLYLQVAKEKTGFTKVKNIAGADLKFIVAQYNRMIKGQ